MALKVLLADDHRLILEGIRRALEEIDDIEIVAEAYSGRQVLPLVGRTQPDLVLMDIRMSGADGFNCLDALRKRHPTVKIVILSAFTDQKHIETALNRGASAYIVKSINPRDLPSALRQAAEETVFHALGIPEERDSTAKAAGLTEREITLLKALARGLSNRAISKELWVTEQTVKFHLTNIYRKLNVANRTEATHYAYVNGFVDSYV